MDPIAIRVAARYKAASYDSVSYDVLKEDLSRFLRYVKKFERQSKLLLEYLESCNQLLRNPELGERIKTLQECRHKATRLLRSLPSAIAEAHNPQRTPNWHDFLSFYQSGFFIASQTENWEGLLEEELWGSHVAQRIYSRMNAIPLHDAVSEIHDDLKTIKGKSNDEWGWR